jgi:hypothetical protein
MNSDAHEKRSLIDLALRRLRDAEKLDERKALAVAEAAAWYDGAITAVTEIEKLAGALRGELLVRRDRAAVE